MKLNKLATLVLTLAAAGAVHAQSLTMADIPFSFVVQGQTMPAGKYIVSQDYSPARVTIRQADGKAATMALATVAEPAGAKDSPKLLFHQYGDRYFLSQAWVSGQCDSFAPTHLERELVAKGSDYTDTVVALK